MTFRQRLILIPDRIVIKKLRMELKNLFVPQKSMLNGFPAVNHGVSGCRTIIETLIFQFQVRHGTPDARLLTEICYAGGFTSYEGGGI